MNEISGIDAARSFSDMLDAVEHRRERFAIVSRGKVVALRDPVSTGKGQDVKALLHAHKVDVDFAGDLASVRELLHIAERS